MVSNGTLDTNLDLTNAQYFSNWDADIWDITDGAYPELKYVKLSNVNSNYDVSFTATFTNETPKGGLFLYVMCIDSADASNYSEIRQYYFEGTSTETITYQLAKGEEYQIVISKPYVWDFDVESSDITVTNENNKYMFTIFGAGAISITATGGTPPNIFAVV